MSKKLSEMSLEELWQLFPIYLTEHRSSWSEWYNEEKVLLQGILPSIYVKRISHIGSTTVETIWAKPIVDILVEVPIESDIEAIKEKLIQHAGYVCMSQSDKRISFNKGYTEKGFSERVYHLHLRRSGDNDELYFRDYLIENSEVAKDYEKLKLSLCKEFEHNRDEYTNRKTKFVTEYTKKAKIEYAKRY